MAVEGHPPKILATNRLPDERRCGSFLVYCPSPSSCRMERHHNIILDGANNPEAVGSLNDFFVPMRRSKPNSRRHSLRFGDKNIAVELPADYRDVPPKSF